MLPGWRSLSLQYEAASSEKGTVEEYWIVADRMVIGKFSTFEYARLFLIALLKDKEETWTR